VALKPKHKDAQKT